MACPTCDHTMQGLGNGWWFWCPRCGTIRERGSSFDDHEAPKLVETVRHFLRVDSRGHFLLKVNMAEQCLPPNERPTETSDENP